MKKLIIAVATMCIVSCSQTNKIAVQANKYGPLHRMKYEEFNGRLYVHGKEVKIIPGTCVYAGK